MLAQEIEFIIYVADQGRSKVFYQELLLIKPSLDVPGMTEFNLTESVKLGLMPEAGIATILGDHLPHPSLGTGIPRCELYLKVDDPKTYIERGIQLGGTQISELANRTWGDYVGYLADPDGHILAFAKTIE
jgi:predicted enzyme related to lactoylglutathione lyase